MSHYVRAVYAPPEPGLPHIAVIISDEGKAVFAFAVDNVVEGGALLALAVEEMTLEAEDDEAYHERHH